MSTRSSALPANRTTQQANTQDAQAAVTRVPNPVGIFVADIMIQFRTEAMVEVQTTVTEGA